MHGSAIAAEASSGKVACITSLILPVTNSRSASPTSRSQKMRMVSWRIRRAICDVCVNLSGVAHMMPSVMRERS